MTVAKFATMPRPGIDRSAASRLKAIRLRLIYKVRQHKASGQSVLASRAETALNIVTHELMRMGAFR